MFKAFEENQLQTAIESLKKAQDKSNYSSIRETANQLKLDCKKLGIGQIYSICNAIDKEFKEENYIGCMSYYASFIEAVIEFKITYRQQACEEGEFVFDDS